MDNICDNIVIYKDKVGKLIKDISHDEDNETVFFRFYPAGYGKCYLSELEIVKDPKNEVVIASSEDCKKYGEKEFKLHYNIAEYIHISDKYQIIKNDEGLYFPHINYEMLHIAFKDLKSALLGMIIYDSTDRNEAMHLNKYIFKLLDMKLW